MRRGIVVYKIIQVYCIPDEGGLQGFVRGYSRLATYGIETERIWHDCQCRFKTVEAFFFTFVTSSPCDDLTCDDFTVTSYTTDVYSTLHVHISCRCAVSVSCCCVLIRPPSRIFFRKFGWLNKKFS